MRTAILAAVGALIAACQHSDVSRELGARCNRASECDERCLGPGNTYPGGFCSIACANRDACPDDATCANIDGGVCLFTCARDADCAFLGNGWRCQQFDLRGGTTKVMACRGS